MATITVETKESIAKKRAQALKEAVTPNDLDAVLENIKKVDLKCSFTKCKAKTNDFAIECKYCGGRFCTTHGLPEIHGCGEAVRRDEKRKFVHPDPKLSNEKHEKAQTKLTMKLKQMELERKKKPGGAGKSGRK